MKECARIVLLSQVRVTSASVLSCRSPAILVISSELAMFILNASVDFSCSKNENSPEVLSLFSAAGDKCEHQKCPSFSSSIAVQAYCLESDPAMIGAGVEPSELFVLSIFKTSRVCTAFGAIKLDFLNNGPWFSSVSFVGMWKNKNKNIVFL